MLQTLIVKRSLSIYLVFYLLVFLQCFQPTKAANRWPLVKDLRSAKKVERADSFLQLGSHDVSEISPVYKIISSTTSSTAVQDDNNTEWVIVTKHECKENEIYDNDLHICHLNCTDEQIFYSATQTCVLRDVAKAHAERSALGLRDRPTCKNISIDPSEYKIDGNGILCISAVNATFPRGHYTVDNQSKEAKVCFPFVASFITCKRWVLGSGEFELRHHGLTLWSFDHVKIYQPGEFYMKNANEAVTCTFTGNTSVEEAAMASIVDLYASAWTVSAVSMLVAFVIYFVSQKLRKSHTKVLLGHMGSLFLFYVTLILRAWGPVPSIGLCLAYGIILHYTFLAAFFWLNVLAFGIWKRLPSFHSHEMASSSRHRFFYLSLYAWGCPLLMSVAAVLADHLLSSRRFQPAFAVNCWFGTVEAKAIFMYGPAALLLAANVFFFVMTVVKLRSFSKDVAIVNKKIHNQMMKMYVKLLVVMGLCWIMEVVSALFGKDYLPYWYFTDFINGLQGFFLFIVYVCKPSVLRDLLTAWERRKCPGCCVRLHEGVYFTRSSIHSNSQREHCSSTSIIPSSEFGLNGSVLTGLSAATLNT